MELIIYCRLRQAILKFANCYPNTNETAFCTALYNKRIQRFCHRMVWTNKKHTEQQTQRKSPYSYQNNFQLNIPSFCSPYSIAFLRYSLGFSLYIHLNIWSHCVGMMLKRFLWRSYVEIQIAQKLVVNEKVVKMRELLKQSLRYFIRVLYLHFRLSLVKKGGSAPVQRTILQRTRV